MSKLKKEVTDAGKFPGRVQVDRPAPAAKIDGEDAWAVERIVDKRKRKGRIEYLVKWENYPDTDNMWLPIANLREARYAIDQYEQHAMRQ